MSEPLTEEQLREHRETAELLERSIGRPWFYESPPHVRAGDAERGVVAIRALLAEVERLKAREADRELSEPTPADIEYLEQIRSNPQIMVMPAGVRLMELVARGLIVVQPKLTELGWRALEGKLELRDTVTHDEDPHGPACDPGDWEANQP